MSDTKPNPVGRPTKYQAEYSTEGYLDTFIEHCKEKEELVSVCQFAVYIRVTEDTLSNWSKAHPEFLVSLGQIKQISKSQLCSGGLTSRYNSTIAKMMLSANHGMHERTEKDVSGNISVIMDN